MNTEHNQATQKGKGNKDKPASKLVMFITRLDESLYEAVRVLSFQHRKSRQEIVGEAIELLKVKYGEVSLAADIAKQ